MIPYWSVLFISAFFSLFNFNNNKNLNDIFWILFTIILIIFVGFRYEVGGDWIVYKQNYYFVTTKIQNYIEHSLEFGFFDDFSMLNAKHDILFDLFSYCLFKMGFSFSVLNLLMAILFVYAISRFCYLQKQPWLALFISLPYLVLVVSTGFVRQGAALSLVIIAYLNLIKNNDYRFIFYILIASLIHKSAFIMIFPIVFINFSFLKAIVITLIFSIFLYVYQNELTLLYKMYIGDGRFQGWYDPSSGALIRVLLNLIPAILCIIYGKSLSDNLRERKIFFIFSIIAIVGFILVFSYPTFIDRTIIYITIIQIYVFSRLPLLFDKNFNILSINILIIVFYSMTFYAWMTYSIYARWWWIPYQIKFQFFL